MSQTDEKVFEGQEEALKADKDVLQSQDSDLLDSASSCVEVASKLVKARQVERNIAATVESLSNCLPVLQMFAKLNRQMSDKKFHPALKTLEQLEANYLPGVKTLEQLEAIYLPGIAHFRFAKKFYAQIPRLRVNIKEASLPELKDFLENIRKFSPKNGKKIFHKNFFS